MSPWEAQDDPESEDPARRHDDIVPTQDPADGREQDSDGGREKPRDDSTSEEVEQIVSLVFARIDSKLEQHLHTQMELPDPDQAAELREKAPEIYQLWLDIASKKAQTESFIQTAQYEVPERLAKTGRPWAMGALFLVLVFCSYIASLGGGAIYVAGIVAAIDLVAMLGLFLGFRPELATGARQSTPKRLPRGEEASGTKNDAGQNK